VKSQKKRTNIENGKLIYKTMININKEEGFGNDSFCTLFINGEVPVSASTFSNIANGRVGNDKFEIMGGDGQAPVLTSTNAAYGNYSFYFNNIGEIQRGIVLQSTSTNYNNWMFGEGDFAIDFMIRLGSNMSALPIFSLYQNSNNYFELQAAATTVGKPQLILYWNITIGGVSILQLERIDEVYFNFNTWYHAAFVRRVDNGKDTFTIFADGNYLTGSTNTTVSNIPYFRDVALIGLTTLNGINFWTITDCYLDEFRISKGHYRWRGNGALPSKGFTVRKRGY